MILASQLMLAANKVYEDRALTAPGNVPFRSDGGLGVQSPIYRVPGDAENVAHRVDAFTPFGATDQVRLPFIGKPRCMARCHLCSVNQVSGLRPHFLHKSEGRDP